MCEKPPCRLISEDGNVFHLMGIVSRTLKQHGQRDEARDMCQRVMASGSYEEALHVMMEYITVE